MLVDKTGLIIASVSKFSYFPVEVESIGASASAIFSASEYQGKNLMLGHLLIFTSEFSKGKIFTASCGPKGVIVLTSDPAINIGIIRLILKRSSEQIEDIFRDFFDPDDEDPINFGNATA